MADITAASVSPAQVNRRRGLNRKGFSLGMVFLLWSVLILIGCKPSNYEKAECAFDVPSGVEIEYGYLTVPEDRSQKNSPMIRLHVAIVRTENPKPDLVVFLQGGPGANTLGFMGNLLFLFKDIRLDRGLIVFDQRGAGYSEPSLNCPEAEEQWYQDWTQNLSMKASDQNYAKALQACHNRLIEEGVDLTAYTSAANAADVEDLRKALGYKQLK